jgi:hypothetical protein
LVLFCDGTFSHYQAAVFIYTIVIQFVSRRNARFVPPGYGPLSGIFTEAGRMPSPMPETAGSGIFRHPALCDFGSDGGMFLRKKRSY